METKICDESSPPEDGRLWIGNLDPRISEYQLLKLVRTFGDIDKFDLMFHRTGQLAGQPRGFAFVTYRRRRNAIEARERLHGRPLGSRNLSVKWANNAPQEEAERARPEINIAALAGAALNRDRRRLSKKTAIQSIEAKLKLMETKEAGDDFFVNRLAAEETPVLAQYQTKTNQPPKKENASWRRRHPYHKKR